MAQDDAPVRFVIWEIGVPYFSPSKSKFVIHNFVAISELYPRISISCAVTAIVDYLVKLLCCCSNSRLGCLLIPSLATAPQTLVVSSVSAKIAPSCPPLKPKKLNCDVITMQPYLSLDSVVEVERVIANHEIVA